MAEQSSHPADVSHARPSDDEAIDLIHRMVETESFTGNERAVAELIVARMQDWGFDDAHIDEAGNAVGIKGEGNHDLILLGHMDTVPGWIPVRIEDGVLSGRGSVDAKGPLAAFMVAVARSTPAPGCRFIVIGATEEEGCSRGARHVRDQFKPDGCIIGEPSNWNAITLGYKGCLQVHYRREQPCGHSAGPAGGVGEAAIAWWESVRAHAEKFNESRERLFKQLLVTLRNIQTSSDGLADHVHAVVGVRIPPDFDVDGYIATLHQFAIDADVNVRNIELAWKGERSSPLARAFTRSLLASGLLAAGEKPRFKLKTGTADMNIVGPIWQCPILAYGPGDSTLDHTPHEHLVLDEYLKAIAVLEGALREWSAAPPV